LTKILKTDTEGRIRTPREDRDALLARYDEGSMSGRSFAAAHGIRYSTFMGWLRRRRLNPRPDSADPMFREVTLSPPAVTGIMVELPMGVRVRLERADQIPVITALSRHLHEASC
jgi:hypothetical protein